MPSKGELSRLGTKYGVNYVNISEADLTDEEEKKDMREGKTYE